LRTTGAWAAQLIVISLAMPFAFASDAMPVAQQNALVQKYCAGCHTDAARNGGLSLEHFDAANAAPSLAAMMVSKITGGMLLETVRSAASDPGAADLVDRKMRSGAMGASGIPRPDSATIDALINALAIEATGATDWNVSRGRDPAPVFTASILRELPSTNSGEAASYRLVLACNATTQEGEMQLTWAPAAKAGELSVTVDGKTSLSYEIDQAVTGQAAVNLSRIPVPAQRLGIQSLTTNESVEFSFSDLSQTARRSLAPCFADVPSAPR
jgi:hypothetical protein